MEDTRERGRQDGMPSASTTGASGAVDDRPGTLYARIEAVLKERIRTSAYPVGSVMPTEAELCTEFSASRYTVREALRRLQEDGLIERRKGSGSQVIRTSSAAVYVQTLNSISDLFQIALETHFVLVRTEEVTLAAPVARAVGGRPRERWLRVTGIRWTKPGGQPICYIHSYVPMRFAHLVAEFATCRGPFYSLLEERSGETIQTVEQEIQAVPMPEDAAASLGLTPQDWALRLLRRYAGAAGTIIASFNWHPADQLLYRMHIERQPIRT